TRVESHNVCEPRRISLYLHVHRLGPSTMGRAAQGEHVGYPATLPDGEVADGRGHDLTGGDQRRPHMPAGRDCRTGGCKRKAAIVGDIEPVLVLDDPPHVAQKHRAPAARQPAARTPGLAAVGGPVDIAGGARRRYLRQVAMRPPDRLDGATGWVNVGALPAPPAVCASEQEVQAIEPAARRGVEGQLRARVTQPGNG